VAAAAIAPGCPAVYYRAMEKLGYQKRDILVSRVEEARDTQKQAAAQFTSALERFKSVVQFEGGDLEAAYDSLDAELKKSETAAAAVRDRIAAVESVSRALFREWKSELRQYSNADMRKLSERKLTETQARCRQLLAAMKKAEAKIEPVLAPLRDQVLFLKHNLNAKAVASLDSELVAVQTNVAALIRDMQAAIEEADRFIRAMQEAGGAQAGPKSGR
jgi:hypothetical protein